MNNEKWHGNSKGNSNSGAGRDGKPYEKRDVKSILKGTRGGANKYQSDRPRYNDDKPRFNEDKPGYYQDRPRYNNDERPRYNSEDRPRYNSEDRPRYNDNHQQSGNRLEFRKRDDSRPFNNEQRRPYDNRESRPSYGDDRRPQGKRPRISQQDGEQRPYRKPYNANDDRSSEGGRLSFRKPGDDKSSGYIETRFDNNNGGVRFRKPAYKRSGGYDPNSKYSNKKQIEYNKTFVDPTKPVRLNKFLANAGICSRREADEFIQAGVITVNGETVSELGVKVLPTDKVMFHNQVVRSERKVYILLNKPKDCVTTAEDTHDRLTVVDLVKNACSERIYPVGRLDRNTTGIILLTNDGDLASRLTHPKYEKKKIYHVALDRALETADFETILAGVQLDEDEKIAADALSYVKEDDAKQVGIEIHSGQNRVVRRIFEKLGYKVVRLDRVYFAGLTKKNLPRGKYRFLNQREVNMLKMGAYE